MEGQGNGGEEDQEEARFKGGWLCSCLVIVHRSLVDSPRNYLLSACASFFILNLKGTKTSTETYVIISSFPHFSWQFRWKTFFGRAVLAFTCTFLQELVPTLLGGVEAEGLQYALSHALSPDEARFDKVVRGYSNTLLDCTSLALPCFTVQLVPRNVDEKAIIK